MTVILINGIWQGVGRLNRVPLGAMAIRRMVAGLEPVVVPVSDDPVLVRGPGGIRGHAALAEAYAEAAVRIEALPDDAVLFNLGGDCASELVPIASLNRRLDGALTVVWIDAHADLNTPETSPSGAAHGMVLRALMGEGEAGFEAYVPAPVDPGRVILAGVRQCDPAERDCIQEKHLLEIGPEGWPDAAIAVLSDRLAADTATYIHVDCDVLDGAAFADSSYPTPGGPSVDGVIGLVRWLFQNTAVAGASLTEFAPHDPARDPVPIRRLLAEGFGLSV